MDTQKFEQICFTSTDNWLYGDEGRVNLLGKLSYRLIGVLVSVGVNVRANASGRHVNWESHYTQHEQNIPDVKLVQKNYEVVYNG